MMDVIRSWLIGITCAAIIVSLTNALMPEGGIKKIARLTGGLILMLAILRPLMQIKIESMSEYMAEYSRTLGAYESKLETENDQLLKVIIEEKSAAYILDKADALGLDCEAQVRAKTGEDGIPYPHSAQMTGAWNSQLSACIETDLDIPADRQTWKWEKDE